MADLYLASQSPRRRQLLDQIGVDHEVISVDVPEIKSAKESPEEYVCRLALEKAKAGLESVYSRGLNPMPVLGSDTLGLMQGEVIEKPRDRSHFIDMLSSLSSKSHQILTSVAVVDNQTEHTILVTSEVTFRELSQSEIERYWETGEPRDKAGGYAIQGLGAVFVLSMQGSYSGVVGLPLLETAQLLEKFGVPVWKASDK